MKPLQRPLLIWSRSPVVYFGEHAEIMRLAFDIPANVEYVEKVMK